MHAHAGRIICHCDFTSLECDMQFRHPYIQDIPEPLVAKCGRMFPPEVRGEYRATTSAFFCSIGRD